ncbi:translation elongation factor-like protein [Candidatus Pacearchaeota archaeon RBG_16_35_8]|nr:MAG: translation elongation factor-like protein [Candidatus Pacearchaeota archaeon RBG_16_35_8]
MAEKVKSKTSQVSTGEKEIGEVSGYFSHVSVAAIKLSAPLKVGDKVHIKGHTTDFVEKISSMQIENKVVKEAKKGDHIGIKVKDKVRPNDKVLLVK